MGPWVEKMPAQFWRASKWEELCWSKHRWRLDLMWQWVQHSVYVSQKCNQTHRNIHISKQCKCVCVHTCMYTYTKAFQCVVGLWRWKHLCEFSLLEKRYQKISGGQQQRHDQGAFFEMKHLRGDKKQEDHYWNKHCVIYLIKKNIAQYTVVYYTFCHK